MLDRFFTDIKISVYSSLILLIFLVPVSLKAQRFHIGLMGGVVGATMQGSYIEDSNGLEMRFHGMLTIDREFNDRWSLETGIRLRRKILHS